MDQQGNSPISSMPTKTNKGAKNLSLIVAVVVGLAMLAGLAYTNVMLTRSNDKISQLNSRVTEINDLSGQIDQVINTGANDKILGFDRVDKDGFQSVFLNGGQVYFGKITEIGTENVILEDVYYLKVSGQDQSLVKLGCELHKPEDKLTITRSNLIFWENLKDKDVAGVVSAIKDYKKANPDGQKCS